MRRIHIISSSQKYLKSLTYQRAIIKKIKNNKTINLFGVYILKLLTCKPNLLYRNSI